MTFDPSAHIVTENVESLSPTIRLNQPSLETFDLIVTLMDVNTTGMLFFVGVNILYTHNNTAGDDYAQQMITVPVVKSSPQSFSFDINLNDDDIVECTEVFNLVISPTSWCGLTTVNNAQVTIVNDDGKKDICTHPCIRKGILSRIKTKAVIRANIHT